MQLGMRGDELDPLELRVSHAVDRVTTAPAHADDFDLRRLQVFTEAHADSCVSYCHAFSNLLQIRWRPPGRVTKRQRTWLSILIPDFPRAAARNAAPSRHTIQVRRSLHIPAAPPVRADQPSPLVPQCAQANGSNTPEVRRARGAARHRPPCQIPQQ